MNKLTYKIIWKPTFLFALILSIVIVFGGCAKPASADDVALTVNSTEIGADIFAYYLDNVLQNKDDSFSKEDALKEATTLCVEYYEVNAEFEKAGLKLSSSTKASVASSVNDLWNIFGGYYEKIGVSKQTLTKIKTSEEYKEDLVSAIYGKGGEKEISEESQKEFFEENYVFFKAISSYLYNISADGSITKISQEELDKTETAFADMKAKIDTDTTIDTVNKEYVESTGGSTESEMEILSTTSNSTSYPKDFFNDVKAMENDAISILKYDDYIFLVQKKNTSSYYENYAKINLSKMAEESFAEYIGSIYKDVNIDSSSSVQSSVYSIINNVKSK